jgi:hypothetical protein
VLLIDMPSGEYWASDSVQPDVRSVVDVLYHVYGKPAYFRGTVRRIAKAEFGRSTFCLAELLHVFFMWHLSAQMRPYLYSTAGTLEQPFFLCIVGGEDAEVPKPGVGRLALPWWQHKRDAVDHVAAVAVRAQAIDQSKLTGGGTGDSADAHSSARNVSSPALVQY